MPLKERPVWKEAKTSILALFAYIISSLAFTYPAAFSPGKFPGTYGDVFWYLWDLWWFKKALLSLSGPYHTQYIFYPTGVDLAFSEITPFNAMVSIPLQTAFGLISAYNILWISTFILSGFGTFLLARYIVGDARAAFISGLIFMFCPYRFAHSFGHLNLITTQWIPFYILFFIKAAREGQRRDALYAALFMMLVGLSSYYYLIYMIIFSAVYIAYGLWSEKSYLKRDRDTLANLGLGTVAFGLAYVPFAYPLLRELAYAESSYLYHGGFEEFSADLLEFLMPPVWHPVFGGLVEPVYASLTGNIVESTLFAGYTVIILSALAVSKVREARFWAISAALFLTLSLGLALHIGGVSSVHLAGRDLSLSLPYYLLMHLPVFSILRVPSRWDVLVMLSLAILSGYGLRYLFNRYGYGGIERGSGCDGWGDVKGIEECKDRGDCEGNDGGRGRRTVRWLWDRGGIHERCKKDRRILAISAAACALILFEFLAVPYPMLDGHVPGFYGEMARVPGDFAVLELPNYHATVTYSDFMYYQTTHQKKLINGYASRTPDYAYEFSTMTPFIKDLIDPDMDGVKRDILDQNISEIAPSILEYYNIKYIILHRYKIHLTYMFSTSQATWTPDEQLSYMMDLLNESGSVPTTYDDGYLIVYKAGEAKTEPFMQLRGGWYGIEYPDGQPMRWMGDEASVLIFSDKDCKAEMSLSTYAFPRPRTLEISCDGRLCSKSVVFTRLHEINVEVPLKKGMNTVNLSVVEGCERPVDIKELKSTDERCLSIAVRKISLEVPEND